ncbi:MAG: RpiB/LacA/LacB family sugar-phosphate isomerase [Candidatus Kerfeldbacteria bacterium]
MTIYLGSDNHGVAIKEQIKALLDERSVEYEDFGTDGTVEDADFPDFAFPVAEAVRAAAAEGKDDVGIVICGSGVGVDIAANKVKGVRAALAMNEYMARQSREHDNANVLALAGKLLEEKDVPGIVNAFLDAKFDGIDRHARRVRKIIDYEEQQYK